MRKLFIIAALFLIAGCSSTAASKKSMEPEKKTVVTAPKRSNESLQDLLQEVDVDAQLKKTCQDLKVELTKAYLNEKQTRPAVIGFCHHNGDVSLEQKPAYIAIAVYDKSTKTWAIDMVKHEFLYHPARFAGILKLDDHSERVVIELYEDPAAYGGSSAIIVSAVDNKIHIEKINSTVTQYGKFHTKGNEIIIEDDHTVEKYTYEKDKVIHTTNLKEDHTKANLVITYNKYNDGNLYASLENGKILDVHPGDIISFKPDKPLSLAKFQIRTSMHNVAGSPDTYEVSESDIGETIEFGEAPYDHMITYTIGDPQWFASKEFLNQLNKGMMPGSKVQLTTPNSEIKEILKDEVFINESGYSGAKHLQYEKFIYAIPFLKEEGDIIYSVIRKLPFGTPLTGNHFIQNWGKPDEIFTDMDSLEESLILRYNLDNGHHVYVYLSGNTTDSQAASIELGRDS